MPSKRGISAFIILQILKLLCQIYRLTPIKPQHLGLIFVSCDSPFKSCRILVLSAVWSEKIDSKDDILILLWHLQLHWIYILLYSTTMYRPLYHIIQTMPHHKCLLKKEKTVFKIDGLKFIYIDELHLY
jgi:hypothetical protein